MNNSIKEILKYLKKELKRIYAKDLEAIILYGSQAREDFVEDSDVDILIILNGEIKPVIEIRRINKILSKFSLKFGKLISCNFMSKNRFESENSPLILNIKKEGISL